MGPGVSVCLGARSATAACVRARARGCACLGGAAADATAGRPQWFSLFLSLGLLASCYWSFQTWRTLQVRRIQLVLRPPRRADACVASRLQFEGVPPPLTAAIGKFRVASIALADQAGGPLRSVMAGVSGRSGEMPSSSIPDLGGGVGLHAAAPTRPDEHLLPPGPSWAGSMGGSSAHAYQKL